MLSRKYDLMWTGEINPTNLDALSFLGDIFESLMGAIFIDSEFCLNTVWSVLHKFMLNELIAFKKNPPKTFLAQMHELYPREHFRLGSNVFVLLCFLLSSR